MIYNISISEIDQSLDSLVSLKLFSQPMFKTHNRSTFCMGAIQIIPKHPLVTFQSSMYKGYFYFLYTGFLVQTHCFNSYVEIERLLMSTKSTSQQVPGLQANILSIRTQEETSFFKDTFRRIHILQVILTL